MNLDRLSVNLARTSTVQSVGQLEGFPFASHAQFVEAYRAHRITILTRLNCWSVVRFLNSWNDLIWFLFIFNGFALALLATVYALLHNDYWYLLGLPMGWACVSSANARLSLIDMLFWLPVILLGLVLLPLTPVGKSLLLLAGVASISKVISHMGIGVVVMEIELSLSESELLLARLFADGYLDIYDRERQVLFSPPCFQRAKRGASGSP